jgi:hypothetical protein
MKVESFVILILMVGFVLIAVNAVVQDFSTEYNVTTSLINSSKYSYTTQINNSISSIQEDISKVGDTTGWKQVLVGASALWNGVISAAGMILLSPVYLAQMVSGASADMGMPSIVSNVLLPIFILILTVYIIFLIVRFVRGDTTV